MAKFLHDNALDGGVDYIVANGERLVLTNGQPANYAAVAAIARADVSVDTLITKANGDVSGRKAAIPARTGVNVDTTGTADHCCLVDDTNSILIAVTTFASQSLTSGNTVDIGAWDIEFADAT